MRLNRDHIPLYYKLKEIIREKIISRQTAPNEPLPTETELCQEYGVSRTTVRQALADLMNEGLIKKIPGKGTFPKIKEKVTGCVHRFVYSGSLDSYFMFMRLDKKIHHRDFAVPRAKISALFIDAGKKIYYMRGVRIDNDIPVCFFITYIRAEHAPFFEVKEFKNEIAMVVLEKKLGVKVCKVSQRIKALKADKRTADFLKMKKGDPVLKLESVYYINNDKVIEVGINYFNPAGYDYTMELRNENEVVSPGRQIELGRISSI